MTLTEFLRDNPTTSEDDVKMAISGNICRCTGYQPVVEAALQVIRSRKGLSSSAAVWWVREFRASRIGVC
jgi:xanthine dehydrogenase iron-sulfur cluster and FAD-binding subunit A